MWYLMLFFLGASVGSFVNVLVARSIAHKDWTFTRSVCDHCKRKLKPYDMIPLLSFFVYLGKSRCCGKTLSLQHPIVELLFGLLFVWWGAMGIFFFHLVNEPLVYLQPMFWLLTGVLLFVVVVADAYYGLIPVQIVYLGSLLVLLYRSFLIVYGPYTFLDFALSLAAGLAGAGFLLLLRLITRGRGMGEGDLYLMFWIGLLLGWPRVVVALWVAFVSGALFSLLLLIMRKTRIGGSVPFGPFLVTGAVVALLFGHRIFDLVN